MPSRTATGPTPTAAMPGSSTSARTLPGGTGRSPTSLAAISPRPPRQTFYGWYDEEKAAYDAFFEAARTATDLGTAQSAYNQAHEDAETARTERESAKQAADGALAVLSTARTESDAADDAYVAARSIDDARIEQREVDQTYTADMTDPDNGISGLAARKVWRSIPSQLLRSSTKKSNTLRSSAVDVAQSSLNRWISLRQRESFPSTP